MKTGFSLLLVLGLAMAVPSPVYAKKQKSLMAKPTTKPPVYKKVKKSKQKPPEVQWGTPKGK